MSNQKEDRQVVDDIISENPEFKKMREEFYDGVPISDILTDTRIKQCLDSGLSLRTLQNVIGISKSTLSRKFIEYNNRYTDDDIVMSIWNNISDFGLKVPDNLVVGDNKVDNVFLLMSDIQAGSITSGRGWELYPTHIIDEYFANLTTGILNSLNRRNLHVDTLYIFMLGDLVDGVNIYPNQKSIPIRAQIEMLVQKILTMVIILSSQEKINRIRLLGVSGNHGRISKNHVASDNYDLMVYDRLEDIINSHREYENTKFKDVDILIADDPIQGYQIGKWNYAMMHGDQINSISENKLRDTLSSVSDVLNLNIDVLLMGHWHSMRVLNLSGKHVIINGCAYESDHIKYNLIKKSDTVQVLFGSSNTDAVSWIDRIKV